MLTRLLKCYVALSFRHSRYEDNDAIVAAVLELMLGMAFRIFLKSERNST